MQRRTIGFFLFNLEKTMYNLSASASVSEQIVILLYILDKFHFL